MTVINIIHATVTQLPSHVVNSAPFSHNPSTKSKQLKYSHCGQSTYCPVKRMGMDKKSYKAKLATSFK
eukprot:m.49483 g.49483  ORF g.49483 m.49483 type:complete len:68 (+) comp10866_c0_seq1:215-418(+)